MTIPTGDTLWKTQHEISEIVGQHGGTLVNRTVDFFVQHPASSLFMLFHDLFYSERLMQGVYDVTSFVATKTLAIGGTRTGTRLPGIMLCMPNTTKFLQQQNIHEPRIPSCLTIYH